MLQIKERKEMEDLFKKAQKPWAKHLAKVEKTKADYHGACKTEKTATNQVRNAGGDSSISQDQVCVIMYESLKTTEIFIRLDKVEQHLCCFFVV